MTPDDDLSTMQELTQRTALGCWTTLGLTALGWALVALAIWMVVRR